MSLLGIDIGTTGCKAVVFSVQGEQLAMSYRNYEIISEIEGYAELDSVEVWGKVMETIREVALLNQGDPIRALSVSSLGEAMVPVSLDREILGNSILGSDQRGSEFSELIQKTRGSEDIFGITGNLPGTFYSMPKVAWVKKYQPDLYQNTDYFLTWADFVCFMLGGKAITNFSLASRTLLFDIQTSKWSCDLFSLLDLDQSKFPPPQPSGIFLGYVNDDLAMNLKLMHNVAIISGGHDQCCATLGSGIKCNSGAAMYGMGTFICVVPVFSEMPDIYAMFSRKLHIEHHVIPGCFISFIYNQSGGALVKWFKQTFTSCLDQKGVEMQNSYNALFSEISDNSTDILVIPRFGATGPPDFRNESKGCISGLSLNHHRGDILRAVLEGISFYIKDCFLKLGDPFSDIGFLVATGGGSVSRKWLQITSDILGKTIVTNKVSEASALGAAIIAGKGSEVFLSFDEAIDSMVFTELTISPDLSKRKWYDEKFKKYQKFS